MISMIFDFLYLAKMHSLQILFFNNLIGTNMNMKLETTNLQLYKKVCFQYDYDNPYLYSDHHQATVSLQRHCYKEKHVVSYLIQLIATNVIR